MCAYAAWRIGDTHGNEAVTSCTAQQTIGLAVDLVVVATCHKYTFESFGLKQTKENK
jgi:hypothetical protein